MYSCDDEKTRYTLYKTLSYVIKCIFLMCAFLFVGLFNEQGKVEAASVAFNTNNTSACWNASGTTLNVTSNCTKYEYVVNFSHTVTNGSVTSIEEFYVNVGSTSYGGQMYTQSGSGQKMRCRGSKVKNINLTITYSSSATSVTYSSSYTRTELKICTSMGTDNNVSITIPTSQLSYSLTLKANMKVTYKKAGSGVEYPSSIITIADAAAPTVPVVISNSSSGNWSKTDVYIKVGNSTDVFSGVSYYQYSYDKSSWHSDIDGTCTSGGAASYNNSSGACGSWRAERNNTVYFRAVDAAGNVSGASSGTTVKIDKTAPTLSVGTPSTGAITGSGTSTVYVAKAGTSVTVTFTDNNELYYYSSTSWYRYGWSTSSSTEPSWTSINASSGSRGAKNVNGTITVPSTGGTHYLWIEGDVRDVAGNYMSNNTSYNTGSTTADIDRKFKFLIDVSAPILTVEEPDYGSIIGSGTSTVYYAKGSVDLMVRFTDDGALQYYDSTSYYRYMWCSTPEPYEDCMSGYSPIESAHWGNRTITEVYGSLFTPSTAGTYYLIIEGDVRDVVGNYMSNNTNMYGVTSTSGDARVFKFIIDTTAPTLTIGTPTSGSILGSGTSTTYYAQSNKSVSITFSDNLYLKNYSNNAYYRYDWCSSADCWEEDYVSVSSNRTSTSVSGTITTPSSAGTYYLWIEGDVTDAAGNYMSNSTNYYSEDSYSSGPRIFKFVIDNTSPTFSYFHLGSSTLGDDGYRYVTGSSFYLYSYYSDTNGIKNASFPSICSTSSTTTGTGSSSRNISSNCNTSSYAVSYTTKRSASVTVSDYAGNSSTKTVEYYKIDTTRKVNIDSFTISGFGAKEEGWVGNLSTTGGGFTPVYSLSNTSYISQSKQLYMYDTYDWIYSVGLLDWETHTSGDVVYYDDTDYLYEMFDFVVSGGYGVEVSFVVKNIYGQSTYYYYYDLQFDFYDPWTDFEDIYTDGTTTYGDNGGIYMIGSLVTVYIDVYDDEYNMHSSTYLLSASTSFTSEITNNGSNLWGNIYIDITQAPVSFDAQLYLQYYVFDNAGNYVTGTLYYYKIDTSRDIGISNFAVRGKNSNVDNYIGSQGLTGGNVAPIYTLSNTSYLSNRYMMFYVGITSTTSTTSTYRLVYQTNKANITSTISSGTYINVASGYSGTSTTVATWYSNITEGSTRYAKIIFKNIYGRTTTATVQVVFDYTAPTISTFNVIGNSGAQAGYTNTRNVTYSISASDTYLYSYQVGDDDIAEQMNYSTTKPTSGTMPQSYQGTHYFYLYVEDRAGNGIYSYDTIVYDSVAPTVSMSITTGTVGKNGSRYVVGNSSRFSVSYTEATSGAYSVSMPNGCTHTLSLSTGTNSGTATCDITSVAINFDTDISRNITVKDYAGNSNTASVEFYKIDDSRRITISDLYIHARGSLVNNWIGSRELTQGDVAAYYTMGNSQYLDDSYLYFTPDGYTTFIYASNTPGITNLITPGTYVNVGNSYGSGYTVDEWYDYNLSYIVDEYSYDCYYYPNIDVKNIYGQYTYAYGDEPIRVDEETPTLDYVWYSYDYTIGADGQNYTLGSYFDVEFEYYDLNAYTYAFYGPDGFTYDDTYPIYQDSYGYVYLSGDLSTVAVDFDTAITICLYMYDYAGNYNNYCESFYKIDTSRDITISSFGIRGNNSQVDNYIGPKSLTSGNIAPIYTLTNAGYINNNYMTLYVGTTSSSSTTSTYRFVYKTNTTNIVSTISSGTYINIASGYSGLSTTIDTWYSNIADGSTRYARIQFKNIYGRATSKTVSLVFDYTAPTISSYSVKGNSSAQSGYTNQKAITLSYTPSDTNLYRYIVYDNGTQRANTTSKVTSTTLSNSTNGTHTIKLRVYDKAGNYTETSKDIILDTVVPVTEFSLTDDRTMTMNFNDTYMSTNASIGSMYMYYMSLRGDVDINALDSSVFIIPTEDDLSNSSNIPMEIARQSHYLYIITDESPRDRAGNYIACYDTAEAIPHPTYNTVFNGCIIRTYVDGDVDSRNVTIEPEKFTRNMNSRRSVSNIEILHYTGMIVVTFFTETTVPFDLASINNLLIGTGYTVQTINRSITYDFNSSYVYHDVLVTKIDEANRSDVNELVDLVIIVAAPNAVGNVASHLEYNKGDELGNIAVAFTSDIPFTVDTQITLNGELVKKVDTNRPGVYEMRYIAKDEMGRVNKVYRSVVVNESKEAIVVEEIKEEIEVKETLEVSVLPVEAKVETSAPRKVVENVQVEMRIENKEEVKSYKKKERKNKAKKDIKGTFKLFSKWFFKVYDG